MRLFIAIVPSAEAKRELAEFQKTLIAHSSSGNFVPPANFHLTVRFLGECNALGPVASAMREGVRGVRAFDLRLQGYGSFARGYSRISFASMTGDLAELNRLHQSLESALDAAGLGRDARALKPHITLGREVVHDSVADQALKAIELTTKFAADELVLFESARVRGAMEYHPLHRVKIG